MRDHSGKADFGSIYDRDDPREYFEVLGELGYRIPHHGQHVFSSLIGAKRDRSGDRSGLAGVSVLDLCCSYGINAALLKHDVTMDDLYERYRSEELAHISSEKLAASDVEFYGRRRKEGAPVVAGLDSARSAITYALQARLLDAGFSENLEEDDPSDDLGRAASRADLVTVTGGISYITERTFDRLLDCASPERLPWIAAFPLRSVSYEPISGVLSKHGLVTEKLSGRTFDQRRFATPEERESTLRKLGTMSVDPTGKEAEGSYHTDFYLSRPAEEAAEVSLEELLAG